MPRSLAEVLHRSISLLRKRVFVFKKKVAMIWKATHHLVVEKSTVVTNLSGCVLHQDRIRDEARRH